VNPRDATNKIKFGVIYMATAALIDGFMTKCLPARIPRTATIIFSRGLAAPTDRRDGHHDVLLREIPMLYPGIRRRRRYALGRRRHVVSKLLFEPLMQLWNNRNYYGSEICDTKRLDISRSSKHFDIS